MYWDLWIRALSLVLLNLCNQHMYLGDAGEVRVADVDARRKVLPNTTRVRVKACAR